MRHSPRCACRSSPTHCKRQAESRHESAAPRAVRYRSSATSATFRCAPIVSANTTSGAASSAAAPRRSVRRPGARNHGAITMRSTPRERSCEIACPTVGFGGGCEAGGRRPQVAVGEDAGQCAGAIVGPRIGRADRGEHDSGAGVVGGDTGLGDPVPYRVDEAAVVAQDVGLDERQLRVPCAGSGQDPGQIHAGMERAAEQQGHHHCSGMPLRGDGIDDLVHRRRVQVEEAQPDVDVRPLRADRRHGSRDHPSGSGITTAVCDGDQWSHGVRPAHRARPRRWRRPPDRPRACCRRRDRSAGNCRCAG